MKANGGDFAIGYPEDWRIVPNPCRRSLVSMVSGDGKQGMLDLFVDNFTDRASVAECGKAYFEEYFRPVFRNPDVKDTWTEVKAGEKAAVAVFDGTFVAPSGREYVMRHFCMIKFHNGKRYTLLCSGPIRRPQMAEEAFWIASNSFSYLCTMASADGRPRVVHSQ